MHRKRGKIILKIFKIRKYMLCKSMRKIPLLRGILPNMTSEFVQNLKKTIKRFEKTMKILYCHPEDTGTGGSLNFNSIITH